MGRPTVAERICAGFLGLFAAGPSRFRTIDVRRPESEPGAEWVVRPGVRTLIGLALLPVLVACGAHTPRPAPLALPEDREPQARPVGASVDAPDVERERLHAAIRARLARDARSVAPAEPAASELLPLPPLERSEGTPPALAPSGTLPADSVRRMVRQHAGRFSRCYREALQRSPELSGRVTLSFVIGRDGRVLRAEESEPSLPDRRARACLLEAVFELEFPPSPSGPIAVRYPFLLSPSAARRPDDLPDAERVAERPPPGFEEAFVSGTPALRVEAQPSPPAKVPTPRAECPAGDPMCDVL